MADLANAYGYLCSVLLSDPITLLMHVSKCSAPAGNNNSIITTHHNIYMHYHNMTTTPDNSIPIENVYFLVLHASQGLFDGSNHGYRRYAHAHSHMLINAYGKISLVVKVRHYTSAYGTCAISTLTTGDISPYALVT